MGDTSIRKRIDQRTVKTIFSRYDSKSKISNRLVRFYFFLYFLSVPARSGKSQTRSQSPQRLESRRRDLLDPRKRADFCRIVRRLTAKIRHQKTPVLTQDSSKPCTDRTTVKLSKMASVPQSQAIGAEPQETWTNSWTCWTSDILEEKEQSLDWDLIQMLHTTPNTSMTSLRLDQKSSGPFDKEWNDMTMDMTDLKEIKKEGLSLEDMDMDFPLGIDMPVDAHTMSEDDFLDSFMDLSEFLLPEQPLEETEEVQNVIQIEPLSNTPFMVEPVPEDSVICEEVVSPVSVKRDIDDIDWHQYSDHDYVTKKPCLSPSLDTEIENAIIASTSTSKIITTKVTPDKKYRERRNKNNVASRRSRETRKMKFVNMEDEANCLVIKNAELRERIAEMEILAKEMKTLLVQKLAAK